MLCSLVLQPPSTFMTGGVAEFQNSPTAFEHTKPRNKYRIHLIRGGFGLVRESLVVCKVRDSRRNRKELLVDQGKKIECAGKGVLGKGREWGRGCFSMGFEGLWGQRVGGQVTCFVGLVCYDVATMAWQLQQWRV